MKYYDYVIQLNLKIKKKNKITREILVRFKAIYSWFQLLFLF